MSLPELLRAKSSEHELLAEWHGERASLDEDHLAACQAMLAVGIALREVAEALEVEWGEEARSSRAACSTHVACRRLERRDVRQRRRRMEPDS